MFLNKKSKYPIGLNISDLSIKAVQLKKSRNDVKIQGLGRIILPKGIINDGEIKNEEALVKYLVTLFSKPDFGFFSTNEIVLSLPEKLCFTKLISIENGINKISDIIESEIEKYVPYGIKDVYYDWQVIEKTKFKTNVLIGATPQNIVNDYVNILHKSKLSIVALETESIAISRALLQEESPSFKPKDDLSYIIIDLGGKKTTLTAYARKSIIFSLSLPISGFESTIKIAKTLEINIEKAEKAKIICGLDKEKANGVINDILSENINKLIKRLLNSITYFNHQFNYSQINEIILSGGGANTKNLAKIIKDRTKIKTNIGNAFINLSPDEKYEKYLEILKKLKNASKIGSDQKDEEFYVSQDSLSGYATTIGSALRNLYI